MSRRGISQAPLRPWLAFNQARHSDTPLPPTEPEDSQRLSCDKPKVNPSGFSYNDKGTSSKKSVWKELPKQGQIHFCHVLGASAWTITPANNKPNGRSSTRICNPEIVPDILRKYLSISEDDLVNVGRRDKMESADASWGFVFW